MGKEQQITRDGSHKNNDGRPLKDPSLEKLIAIYNLSPNIVTAIASSTGIWNEAKHRFETPLWNASQGGLLYAQVSTPEQYQDTIPIEIAKADGKVNTIHFVPIYAVKPQSWIFPLGRSLTDHDIIRLSTPEWKKQEPYSPEVGSELELLCIHGRLATPETAQQLSGRDQFLSVMDAQTLDQLANKGAKITLEALKWTTEINFGHSSDIQSQAKADLRVMKTLTQEAERLRKPFLPVSMFPYALEENDLSTDTYAEGISTKNPWCNSKLYRPSHSLQITIENASLQEGRQAQNMWYQVTHLLKALTLDSTIAFGKIHPNMKNILQQALDEGAALLTDPLYIQFIDHNEPLSTREAARLFGSRLGAGVISGPFPETAYDYHATVEKTMSYDETSPTPDRVGSIGEELHHGNMRYKRTIGKQSANEIAALDTIGGNPIKITAIKELSSRLNILFNITNPKELANKAPTLFSPSLTQKRCQNLQIASLLVDNAGVEAKIIDAQGNESKAGILINQLIELASKRIYDKERNIDIPPMTKGIKEELKKSAKVPTSKDFLRAKGTVRTKDIVVPSVSGWYEGPTRGIGTPAHWRRARIRALCALGYTDAYIRSDYIIDGEQAFATSSKNLTENDINRLYERSKKGIFP